MRPSKFGLVVDQSRLLLHGQDRCSDVVRRVRLPSALRGVGQVVLVGEGGVAAFLVESEGLAMEAGDEAC